MKRRFAVVGTGGRATMFLDALAGAYREHNHLAAICDTSPTRMAWHAERLAQEYGVASMPCYAAERFAEMIRTERIGAVIVTTPDATHDDYIITAMNLGCDVICEKPMTTTADKAKAILATTSRTGRRLRITFNYRYSPHATRLYELVRAGTIGTPLAVDFCWLLDTRHGADYFRRWHRSKKNSGGLLVHKATHHFDLVNWWLGSVPQSVFAMGDLKFYGRQNAELRGDAKFTGYPRYTGSTEAFDDPFALSLDTPQLKGLYLDAEQESGYLRDQNVFGEGINIEDTMAVLVRYRSGVIMNYSLLAYAPWEGMRIAITGTKGRLELYDKHGSHIIAGQGDEELAAQQARGHEQSLRVFPMFQIPYEVDVPPAQGGHGGADPLLLEQLFSPIPPHDPFGRTAEHLDGAASLLIGICANESIRSGRPIACDELLRLPLVQ